MRDVNALTGRLRLFNAAAHLLDPDLSPARDDEENA